MDGLLITSSGSRPSRLRNSASMVLARSSKGRQANSRNHSLNYKNSRNVSTRSNSLRNNLNLRHIGNFNRNVNGNKDGGCFGIQSTGKNAFYKGKFSREVYDAICLRLGHTPHIPGDSVQALFNDMHLYPSKSQVSEMLHCARQCGRRNGATPFLTFGEFCVFAREMQRPKQHRKTQQQTKSNKCTNKCEVFLGGSCNPTTWRTDTAIPELEKHGITFYNPQVSMWAPELVAQEHDAKQSASVLLYVVDSQTRSTGGMVEVVYLVASGRCVVLVVYPYIVGQSIMGEIISQQEYLDLVEGQTSLLMLVKSSGVKVHNCLPSALQCTANLLRRQSTNGLTPEEQVTQKLRKLRDAFDSYDMNRTGELHLNDALDAYYRLTNRSLKISDLYNYLSTTNSTDPSRLTVTFEQFCALVAEFSTDGCETTFASDEWVSQPLQRQCSMNNNTNCNMSFNLNEPKTDPVTKTEQLMNETNQVVDIFLGGSCSTQSTWRQDIAIPLVKKQGLTYYNPAIRETNCINSNYLLENGSMYYNGTDEMNDKECTLESEVLRWKNTMDKSKVLLFVVTNDTRSLTTMIFASHYTGLDQKVVLCIQQLPTEDCEIHNEKLSKQAIKDYNRGRAYLTDFAKRKHVPVFENVTEAVQCAINMCQSSR